MGKGLFGWGVYSHILKSIDILVVVSRLVFLLGNIEVSNLNTKYINISKSFIYLLYTLLKDG
jgi:uncharacterized membrane protein